MLSGFFNWNILIFLSKRHMSIVWFENSFLKLIRTNLRYSHDNIFLKTFKILWPKHTSHMIFLVNFLTIFTKKSMFDFALNLQYILNLWFCIENQYKRFHWKSIDFCQDHFPTENQYKISHWIYGTFWTAIWW